MIVAMINPMLCERKSTPLSACRIDSSLDTTPFLPSKLVIVVTTGFKLLAIGLDQDEIGVVGAEPIKRLHLRRRGRQGLRGRERHIDVGAYHRPGPRRIDDAGDRKRIVADLDIVSDFDVIVVGKIAVDENGVAVSRDRFACDEQ